MSGRSEGVSVDRGWGGESELRCEIPDLYNKYTRAAEADYKIREFIGKRKRVKWTKVPLIYKRIHNKLILYGALTLTETS